MSAHATQYQISEENYLHGDCCQKKIIFMVTVAGSSDFTVQYSQGWDKTDPALT
jgi:hypothetical protein